MKMIKAFEKEYGDLGDAWINSIEYNYTNSINIQNLTIVIQCKNIEKNYLYEKVKLEFSTVKNFLFRQNGTFMSKIFEAKYFIHNNLIYFDFCAESEWESFEEMIEKSDFYIGFEQFSFSIIQ